MTLRHLQPASLSVLIFSLLVCTITRIEAKSVLITGGAGFIGFHTGLTLAEDKDNEVVVIDIFDNSYGADLKTARAASLKEKGITVHSGDVCNRQLLEHLFEKHKFTHIVHLAGKEGHEESMEHYAAFIKANTECLLTLVKVLAEHKDTHLVFASSYNVLDEDDKGLTPVTSMYTSLKTGGERLVSGYCRDYGVSAVGIRPFSVYGPWGRPDGDIYRMALEINSGETVQIYRDEDSTAASRDYTFVSDVVNGALLAMKRQPATCGEIYNIGSGAEPVSMETVFSILKEEMGKDAEMKMVPLPKYEPLVTRADLTKAKEILEYQPKVEIRQGIKEFVKWFKEYYNEKKWSSSPAPDKSLSKTLGHEKVMFLNRKYKKRLLAIREEYEKKAIENNLPVRKYFPKDFIKFENFEANTEKRKLFKSSSISSLTEWCRMIDECVAFDSKGQLFSYIPVQNKWRSSKSVDLYVSDIDVCKAGLISCYGNCTCTYAGPSQAEYGCEKGFGMLKKQREQHYCLELYVQGKETAKEKEFKILDKMENRDWEAFISGKEYVHFPNKYMDFGVVAYYPDGAGNVEKLKAACDDTYHCMGFTTNGELKGIINHVHRWKESNNDLYLRDVDYCNMHEEKCQCKRVSPAKYECTGKKP